MKKVFLVVAVAAMVFMLAAPVAAAPEGVVGKYTAIVDAEKDEAYSESFQFNIFDQEEANRGDGWYSTYDNTSTNMDATIFYLWDNEYLYAFIEVTMNNLTDAGKDVILGSDNPWESDSVELWFLWEDLDVNTQRLKTSVDAFHGKEWGDGPLYEEVAPNGKAVTKMTDKGYNAEFKVAIPKDYLKEGGKIKATLQVNDHSADGTIAVGQQMTNTDAAAVLTLGAAITIAEPEPAANEPESAANEPESKPEITPTHAPQTGDYTIGLLIMALIALAGFTAVKRNKRTGKKNI